MFKYRLAYIFLTCALVFSSHFPAQSELNASEKLTADHTIPPRISVTEFARKTLISRPRLSPDGKKMAALFANSDRELMGIHYFDGSNPTKYIKTSEKYDLRWYRWADNDHLLLSVSVMVPWFGGEAEATRLLSYNIHMGTFTFIGRSNEGLEGDDVLYVDPQGKWLLLSIQRSIYANPTVFRVNIATNEMQPIVNPRPDVWEWFADQDGLVRAGIGFSERYWSLIYRKAEGEKFQKLGKAKYDDEEASMDLLRFARNSDEGFVLSNQQTGRYALYRYNFATKQRGERIFASDTNDITDYATTGDGSKLKAVWYTDERDRIIWFDESMKSHQSQIDNAIKNKENWIMSRTPDDRAMIVWTGASNDPGQYYLYEPEFGVMRRIAKANEALDPRNLVVSKYVFYTARDGLKIPAYLTLPRGRAAKDLPLVIFPHGGPYDVRDKPEYNPEVQFLANRGYAVLQPNYRGSGSYGKDFYEKGEGQWGRQMQDDLDDGMDWLKVQGIIDPRRVCIIGGSYGGYAALWGATRNPERYRCAASFAGVSDLGRQLKYQLEFRISRKYRKDWRRKIQGEPEFDTKSVSPLYTVPQLKVPVLVVHGEDDQTVPFNQSKLYVDALKAAGKTVEFHSYKGEGHGFSSTANFEDWLTRLEAFLNKYNPADSLGGAQVATAK